MGGLDSARILVGGLPVSPPEVFKHAVYFNPHDLFSEYVRPARARKQGADIAPAPMEVAFEKFHDNEVGQLEMFLSDGLRSLLNSYPDVADMAELTLRWPGHLEAMSNLHKMGLMGVRYPASDFPDMLLLVVEAKKGAQSKRWRMLDRHSNSQSAMSRTTGYTTAAIAMLLARKQFSEPGVHAPEKLGHSPQLVQTILADLAERGVKVTEDAATPA
jgi:saccharopine dehydrogenase-like NADP-dependent oxidoreductase